jgi:hypothetical protein
LNWRQAKVKAVAIATRTRTLIVARLEGATAWTVREGTDQRKVQSEKGFGKTAEA